MAVQENYHLLPGERYYKDSVRVAHPSMPEAEIDGLMITTHDLIKFACSTVVVLSGVWKSSCPPSWDKVL